MFNENIIKWATTLKETDAQQGAGALCLVGSTGERAYCCLGLGSTLVPNMPIREPIFVEHLGVETMIHTEHPHLKVCFGNEGVDALAPIEFMEWLGYDMSGEGEPQWRTHAEFDVYIDFPEALRERNVEDLSEEGMGYDREYDSEGNSLAGNSCASLNDDGFTFTQIGDLILFFGLSDRVR